MCHTDDSRAPGPPDPGEVGEHGPLELVSADGTRFAAYRAAPAAGARRGIVILPDVRGLHPFYVDLTQRFAEAGFVAIAVDYFGRTAGTGPRDEDFPFREHVAKVTPEQVRADVAAAVDALRAEVDGPLFTVGFCFGGGQSWRLAASDLDLAGVMGFYGRPVLVADVVDDVRRPLLLLVAGADAATPLDESRALAARLDAAGKSYEMYVYDGAPHSFFDRSYAQWQSACADAWQRMLDFARRQV